MPVNLADLPAAAPSAPEASGGATPNPTPAVPDQKVDLSDLPAALDLSDLPPSEEQLAKEAPQHLAAYRAGEIDADPNQVHQWELAAMGGKTWPERVWDQTLSGVSQLQKAFYNSADAAHNYLFNNQQQQPSVPPAAPLTKAEMYERLKLKPGEILGHDPALIPPEAVIGGPTALATGTAKLIGGAGSDLVASINNAIAQPPGFFGEDVTPEAKKDYDEDQAMNAATADIINHGINKASTSVAKAAGVDPNTLAYQALEQLPAFMPIVPAEFGGAERVAAGLSRMGQKLSPVAKLAAAYSPELVASGSIVHTAAGALGIPVSLLTGAGFGGLTRGVNDKIIKAVLGLDRPELAKNVKLALQAPNGVNAIEQATKPIAEEINNLRRQIQDLTPELEESDLAKLNAKRPNGDYVWSSDKLKGTAKQVRANQEQEIDLSEKLNTITKQTQFHKFLNDTAAYGANMIANTGIAAGIGGGFGAATAPTGQGGQGFTSGALYGASIGAAFSPFAAYSGMHNLRLEHGRGALTEMGSRGFDMNSLNGVPDYWKSQTLMANGYARAMGGEIKVVDPAQEPKWPNAVPAGAPEGVAAMPANGFIDENSNTLYLNKNALSEGTAFHELRHLMQRFTGQMLRVKAPEVMAPFEEAYADASGNPNFLRQPEMDAEIGRIAMMHTPIESFYGGERTGDVIGRIARGIANYFTPDKVRYDPTLNTPYTPADIETIRQQMFKLGELAQRRRFVEPIIESGAGSPPPPGGGGPPLRPTGPAPATTVLSPDEQQVLRNVLAGGHTLKMGLGAGDVGQAIIAAKEAGVEVNDSNIMRMLLNQINGRDILHGLIQGAAPTPKVFTGQEQQQAEPVSGGVPRRTAEVQHPDYGAIRAQAEDAMRQKLAGSKAKDVQQKIEHAGIIAAAQAHAQAVGPDSDLITWRQDKFGKTWIGGQRADPNDPFHQMLLQRANLSPEATHNLNDLEANMGRAIAVDYSHAPEEGQGVTHEAREAARAEATAPERVAGEVAREKLTKSYVPTAITYHPKANAFVVNGFSPDKFLNNANVVIEWAKSKGIKTYDGINDPLIVQHMQELVENHQNGFTGIGKPIKGTEKTPVEPTPGYTPNVIPRDYLDQLNVMMGNDSAKTGVKGLTPEQAEKQALAKQNSPYFDPKTGETNRFRAQMGDKAKDLEPVYETLRPELIDGVRQETVQDEQTLRPSGFTGDRAQLGLRGLPRQDFAAAGFMPATRVAEEEGHYKQFGVEPYKGEIDLGGRAEPSTETIHMMDIPPEMAQTVKERGLPMFKQGGVVKGYKEGGVVEPGANGDQGSLGIYLIRHGCTKLNEESSKQSPDVIRGHADVPLDDKGRKQAEKIGKELANKGIKAVYASDLSRAMDTGRPVSESNNAPLIPTYGLRPWDLGKHQGKPSKDAQPEIERLVNNPDERAEGGESFGEFKNRFLTTMQKIVRDNHDKTIAVVTHYRGSKLLGSLSKNGEIDTDKFTDKDGALEPGGYQFLPSPHSKPPLAGVMGR